MSRPSAPHSARKRAARSALRTNSNATIPGVPFGRLRSMTPSAIQKATVETPVRTIHCRREREIDVLSWIGQDEGLV